MTKWTGQSRKVSAEPTIHLRIAHPMLTTLHELCASCIPSSPCRFPRLYINTFPHLFFLRPLLTLILHS